MQLSLEAGHGAPNRLNRERVVTVEALEPYGFDAAI
jgi:hypothetical protein